MRTSRRHVPLVLAVGATGLAVVAGAAPAAAVRPPAATTGPQASTSVNPVLSWQQLTSGGISNFFQPSLLRTGSGLLVAWRRDDTSLTSSIRSKLISPGGTPGTTKTAVTGWAAVASDPALVSIGGTPRVVFGGERSIAGGETYTGQMALASWDGTAWTFDSTKSYSNSRSAYASYGTTAVSRGGGLVSGFALNGDLVFHEGGDTGHPATAPDLLVTEPAGISNYHLAATVQPSTGTLWAAWWVLDNTGTGALHYATVLPTKGTIGKLPERLDPDQRVALANGPGGPWVAYLAGYPSATSVKLFNLVTKRTITVPGSADAARPVLAAGPGGRLWVAWNVRYTGKVKVTRTNTAVTAFEPVQTIDRGQSVYTMAAQGSAGPLDIVVNSPTTASATAYGLYYRRVLPRLTATATYSSGKATVKVTDAGLAIAGATVKYGTKSALTSSSGIAVLPVGTTSGSRTITVVKAGYKTFSFVLKVP